MALNSGVTADGPRWDAPDHAGRGVRHRARRAHEPHPAQSLKATTGPAHRGRRRAGAFKLRGTTSRERRRPCRRFWRRSIRSRRKTTSSSSRRRQPAEINLAENDIVNMGSRAPCPPPVLLAGDIDPGGVVCQLYGTVAPLRPRTARFCGGLVVNKFRGDVKSCARVWPRSRRCAGFPSWGSCRILRSTWTTRTRSRRAYLPARRAASSTSPSCAFRICRTSPTSTRFRACRGRARYSSTTDLGRPDLVVLPAPKTTLDDARGLRLAAPAPVYARFRARALRRCSAYAEATSWETSFPTCTAGKALARARARAHPRKYGVQDEKRLARSELGITGAFGAFSAWNAA